MPVAHSSSHIASQLIGTKLIKQIGLSIICIANAKNNNEKVTIEQSTAKCNQMMFFYSNQTIFLYFTRNFLCLFDTTIFIQKIAQKFFINCRFIVPWRITKGELMTTQRKRFYVLGRMYSASLFYALTKNLVESLYIVWAE